MELGLTIPLQRYLKLQAPPYGTQPDLRLCWDLHLLTPGGAPSFLAVHCSSRFTLLLYGLSAAEWQRYPALFAAELRRALVAEGFGEKQAARYESLAGPPCITKTHGRRPVAFLNRAVEDVYSLPLSLDAGALAQPQLAAFVNGIPCRAAGHPQRGTARQFLKADMAALLG